MWNTLLDRLRRATKGSQRLEPGPGEFPGGGSGTSSMWRAIAMVLLLGALGPGQLAVWHASATAQEPSLERQPSFSCADVTSIPVTECQALEALYNDAGGAFWHNKTGWLMAESPCTWHGVSCEAGHVTALDLHDNELSGSIPDELGALSRLRRLSLWRNELAGPIPNALGSLAELQYLNLADNLLTGSLPSALSRLTQLQELIAWTNQLTGEIPQELGDLENLRVLVLTDNRLSGSIPAALGNLAQLEELGVGANSLEGEIPQSLGQLWGLRKLILASNDLSGTVPASLGQLSELQQLWLNDNHLEGTAVGWAVPPELGQLSNLQLLALARNRLSGAIPPSLGNLSNLQELWLQSNRLAGKVPQELCNLSPFAYVDLGYNMLTDAPQCLYDLDPYWITTQTVPPENLEATVGDEGDVILTWSAIPYRGGAGYYEVSAKPAGGFYRVLGTTSDKEATSFPVQEALAEGLTYNFRIRTFTPALDEPPAFQQSDLWSDYSPVVVQTIPGESEARKLHLPLAILP